ncbi:unnamed protein product [Parnassius apollo]|uniref:(apollo) hypothetical protein n=1 Tax=Parnassius apollo TaxID=110799 RepID=A0A8S3VZY7_PARAO|nr:unnamed protein product [Parnassius apollo]
MVTCGSESRILAFAGHENINKAMVTRRGKSILFHENYIDIAHIYDIGLIFLERGLPLGNTMKRVILTKQNSVGLTAVVAGWGLINDVTRERTHILRSAKQDIRPIDTCFVDRRRLPGMTCAGSTNMYLPRPTVGDSGSALVIENNKQIGLVSFRFTLRPGLVFYTNTSYFYDWIKENSQFLLQCKINNAQNEKRHYYELN